MKNNNPRVFISYSQEDENYKNWIKNFANELIENGIDVRIDQYDVDLGQRLPQFMEQEIEKADFVLVMCTPNYKLKADSRVNGVGYEANIISGELFSKSNDKKFIPVLCRGGFDNAIPTFLLAKLGVDLTDKNNYENKFKDLLTTIYNVNEKPKIGEIPEYIKTKMVKKGGEKFSEVINDDIKILGIITIDVTIPRNDGTRGSALYSIPFKLSKTPSTLWRKIFINKWNWPSECTTMHRPGIAEVYQDRIVLNGTTIEEVENYHRDTLVLCIEETNEEVKKIEERELREKERKEKFKEEHYSNVFDKAKNMKF